MTNEEVAARVRELQIRIARSPTPVSKTDIACDLCLRPQWGSATSRHPIAAVSGPIQRKLLVSVEDEVTFGDTGEGRNPWWTWRFCVDCREFIRSSIQKWITLISVEKRRLLLPELEKAARPKIRRKPRIADEDDIPF
jgi:hypothetical protein